LHPLESAVFARRTPEATLQARLEAEVGYMGPLPPYRSSPCRMFPGTLPY
jgi:hypothetical protein